MDKKRPDYHTPHPSTFQWFEWKLVKIMQELRDRFFSYSYYIERRRGIKNKRIKRDTSNRTLIEEMCEFENHLENNGNLIATEHLNPYEFLKLVLEKNAPLWSFEEDLFGPAGIKRNRSGLTLPEKNIIATQCAAQVLWHLEGDKNPTIESMGRRLLSRDAPFFELLSLERFNSTRTIEDWVRPMFPISPEERKKHWSREKGSLGDLVAIPGVFSEAGINFLKLHFAAICLTRVLRTLNWQLGRILQSEFINLLAGSIQFYLHLYVHDWVEEAFVMNGSIFPL